MRSASLLLVLLLSAMLAGESSAQVPAPTREFLAGRGSRYARAREQPEGLTRKPAALLRRLLDGDRVVVIDVRPVSEFDRFRLASAASIPLVRLFESGGDLDLPQDEEVWVVGADGPEAVEAMVFLRIAGVRAIATSDGMRSLQRTADGRLELAPGSPWVDAEIRARWESVAGLFAGAAAARVLPPAEAGEVDQNPPPAPSAARGIDPWLIGISAAVVIALLGTLLQFLVLAPRKKKRALERALESLATADEEDLDRAEELLSLALTAGLRPAELSAARFALAYVRARDERYAEALALVRDIPTSSRQSEDRYLEIWLEVKQGHFDQVVRLYDEDAQTLAGVLDATTLAGVALLQEGRAHLARRDTETALSLFQRLRKLGVLEGKLPDDLRDREVLLGVQALVDNDTAEAEKRFKAAKLAYAEQGRPTAHARLGLLLCRWRAEETPDIDDELGAVLGELESQQAPPLASRDPDDPESESLAADGEPSEPGPRTGPGRFLRDTLMWFAMSGLFRWLRFPEKGGLPDEERDQLEQRLARVVDLDPDMGDPHLVAGLIAYYFAEDDRERVAAVDRLERALEADVHLPEVRYLVARERKLLEAAEDSLESYLKLVRDYLVDEGVPLKLRQQLRERLSRFRRFQAFGELDLRTGDAEAAPTLRDLQTRGALMRRRVERIVKPRLRAIGQPDDSTDIESLVAEIKKHTEELAATARRVEDSEQNLMMVTGEFLLEEEPLPDESEH